MSTAKTISLVNYASQIRNRLLIICASIGAGFAVSYAFSEKLVDLIRKTISQQLVFVTPSEAFFVNLKVSLFAGIFLSIPLILYQTWKLIGPGLQEHRKYTLLFILFATIFFITGACFAYFVIIPFGITFLLSYANEQLKPMITIGNYLSFTLKLMLAFGLVFQLPIIMFFITRLGIVDCHTLAKNRKYAIIISFTASAVLTPPDVFTQLLMALPMIILFEISLLISRQFEKKNSS
jgi:sec-independent protein translocase protein TatC